MEHTWVARNVKPIVILYMLGVFAAFMVLAYFVFDSPGAVKALLLAAVAGVASATPEILTRHRYRLTASGLMKARLRPEGEKKPKALFTWDELSHVIPTKSGFKYYKDLPDSNALRRFFQLHFSDSYSGDVRVEAEDQARVMEILHQQGIPTSKLPPIRQG